jgi:hypothetical protein
MNSRIFGVVATISSVALCACAVPRLRSADPVEHSALPSIPLACADAVEVAHLLSELAESKLAVDEMLRNGNGQFIAGLFIPHMQARYAADPRTNSLVILSEDVFTIPEVLELVHQIDTDRGVAAAVEDHLAARYVR